MKRKWKLGIFQKDKKQPYQLWKKKLPKQSIDLQLMVSNFPHQDSNPEMMKCTGSANFAEHYI